MRRFGRKSSALDEEGPQSSLPDAASPARSQRSSNSSSRGGSSLRSGNTSATKSTEHSPARFGATAGAAADAVGAAAGGGGAVVAVSNRKMLKIGANVRFRGDVMECNTVVLCGRLQVWVWVFEFCMYSLCAKLCVCAFDQARWGRGCVCMIAMLVLSCVCCSAVRDGWGVPREMSSLSSFTPDSHPSHQAAKWL